MALRNYQVVVDPTAWRRSLGELAAALEPVTGAETTQLERLLQRGTLTIGSDLSADDAEGLKARLRKQGIPAEVVDDDGATAHTVEAVGPRVTTKERAAQDRVVGRTLKGTYEIVAKIGEGGMGDVYRAVQHPLEREVAIKIVSDIDDEPDAEHYFIREVQTINQLRHPNIVAIQDFGREEDFLFLVMEYLPGRTLLEVLRDDFPLDPKRICKICIQILKALEAAHEKGVVHCDLKPANVMLETVAGESDFVKILDFGVAKYTSPDVEAGPRTNKGNIVGTFDYMSPEQLLRGDIDGRADIWALGVMLYEILTGDRPFHDKNPAKIIAQVLQRDPVAPSQRVDYSIAPQIERITLKALNRDVRDRFSSAAEMRSAFEDAELELKTGVVSLDELERASKPRASTLSGFQNRDEPRKRIDSDVDTEDLGKDTGWGALYPQLNAREPQAGEVPPVFRSDEHVPLDIEDTVAPDTDESAGDQAQRVPAAAAWPDQLMDPPIAPPAVEHPAANDAPPPSNRDLEFDAAVLQAASPGAREEPPYKPQGYDDSVEHVPLVAALLSAVAPGAGQIYNGQDSLALGYGLRFFMGRPWIESVRHAWRRGERIRDYWAPRPQEGSFLRAVGYLFAWQFAVWASLLMFAWVGGKIIDAAGREDAPPFTERDVMRALIQVKIDVQEARLAGLDALSKEHEEGRVRPEQRFTMEDKERAARLFAKGYERCAQRDVARCDQFMARVLELQPGHKDAIRLQTWAVFEQNTGGKSPMPVIVNLQTLADIEAHGVQIAPVLVDPEDPPAQPPEPADPVINKDVGIAPPTEDAK